MTAVGAETQAGDPAGDERTSREAPRRPWCRGSRLLVGTACGWLAVVVLHLLLSGRWWAWALVDLAPPLLYAAIPVLLLAAVPVLWLVRVRPPRAVRLTVLGTAVAALLGTAVDGGYAGLNPGALTEGSGAGAPVLRVLAWDTLYWDEGEDPGRFYGYLKAQHADVYVLQEHLRSSNNGHTLAPVDDSERLRRAFPGYTVASVGELVTLSRFPIVAQIPLGTPSAPEPRTTYTAWPDFWNFRTLRTDLLVAGRTLSVYNVHFPDLLDLDLSPVTPRFYAAVHQLDQRRRAQARALTADLVGNSHPRLVTGVTNTLPGVGDQRWFTGLDDATGASRALYPTTLTFLGLPLWPTDWVYASHDVRVGDYNLVDPLGMSTHRAQNFVLRWR